MESTPTPYADLGTAPTTTDEVRKAYERPALTALQVEYVFRYIERICQRLDERAHNDKLIVAAFDRFTGSLDRHTAAITNLTLRAQEWVSQAQQDRAALAGSMATMRADLDPLRELIQVVSDEALVSECYTVQANEALRLLRAEVKGLPPMIRTALELALSSASLERQEPPTPIVLVQRSVAAD